MISSTIAKEKVMEKDSSGGLFSEALWLAKKDVRRAWLSYPASGLFVLILSLIVAPTVDGFLTVEGFGESGARVESFAGRFFPDYMFLVMTAILAVNAISMDYMRVWRDDVFSERLTFLRRLPASPTSLVASRVMSMLVAVPFTVPAFFLPIYFLSDLGELGLAYIWFAGIWFGWSLTFSGISILGELAASGRVYVWFSVAFIGALVAFLVVFELATELSLVERTANLAVEHGPIPAVVSILTGGVVFFLLARKTRDRIERRELS